MIGGIGSTFELLGQRMDYLKQRHAVIGQNVANADSPGYKARDLVSFEEAMKGRSGGSTSGVQPVVMSMSSPLHIAPDGARVGGNYPDKRNVSSYEVLPDGNNVVLEEQMVKVAEIGSDYQLMINLYKRMQGMVHTALGRA
ncbi:MAG: flagellar basal body rod protein FlgB [Bdellovibrionales bacterium]